MPALIGFVCGCGFTGGCWLVVTGLRRSRRRRDLAERLGPFAPTPLADEVEDWLHHHG